MPTDTLIEPHVAVDQDIDQVTDTADDQQRPDEADSLTTVPQEEPVALSQWLHLIQDTVSVNDLAEDFLNNPEKYDPGLGVHIGRLLLREGKLNLVAEHLDRFEHIGLMELIEAAGDNPTGLNGIIQSLDHITAENLDDLRIDDRIYGLNSDSWAHLLQIVDDPERLLATYIEYLDHSHPSVLDFSWDYTKMLNYILDESDDGNLTNRAAIFIVFDYMSREEVKLSADIGLQLIRGGLMNLVIRRLNQFEQWNTVILEEIIKSDSDSFYELISRVAFVVDGEATTAAMSRLADIAFNPPYHAHDLVSYLGNWSHNPGFTPELKASVIERLVAATNNHNHWMLGNALGDMRDLGADIARNLIYHGYTREVLKYKRSFAAEDNSIEADLMSQADLSLLISYLGKLSPQRQSEVIRRALDSGQPELLLSHIAVLLPYLQPEHYQSMAVALRDNPELHQHFIAEYIPLSRDRAVQNHDALNELLSVALSSAQNARFFLKHIDTQYAQRNPWAVQAAYDRINLAMAEGEDKLANKGKTRKQSIALAKFLNGGEVEDVTAELNQLKPEQFVNLRARVNEIVGWVLDSYKEEYSQDEFISKEDVQSLSDEKQLPFYLKPFREVVNSLIANYMIQSEIIDSDEEREDYLLDMLQEQLVSILEICEDVYIKEIPLYDKLYREFDELRRDDRNTAEIYLGRDGIDAWFGRRAANIAQRRNMTPEERRQAELSGHHIKLNTLYVVYPTSFTDIQEEVKRDYIKDQGINPNCDPIFYDTGFRGTVPEDILGIMGYGRSQMDERIRLLSTNTVSRRALRRTEHQVDENRSEVDFIESNPKPEEKAKFVFQDPATGKMNYYAEPTEPMEQFRFMMIRQIIVRHFYVKEMLKAREVRDQIISYLEVVDDAGELENILSRVSSEQKK